MRSQAQRRNENVTKNLKKDADGKISSSMHSEFAYAVQNADGGLNIPRARKSVRWEWYHGTKMEKFAVLQLALLCNNGRPEAIARGILDTSGLWNHGGLCGMKKRRRPVRIHSGSLWYQCTAQALSGISSQPPRATLFAREVFGGKRLLDHNGSQWMPLPLPGPTGYQRISMVIFSPRNPIVSRWFPMDTDGEFVDINSKNFPRNPIVSRWF
ncbi:hypothetical protein C8J57DRAFT_1254337 [Mycena rebaudengoi]|nr:hypothetical protein C8J57DRAFT_1254337 [Mycena rebaudengoi]